MGADVPWIVTVKDRPGLYVDVVPTGGKSYLAVARTPDGRQKWNTLGPVADFTIEEARDRARLGIRRVKDGLPFEEAKENGETFGAVAESYMKRRAASGK